MKYDFTILGVGKTGTTSIFGALSKHPEICPSRVKEPITRINSYEKTTVLPELYFNEYFSVSPETKVILDGTPNAFVNEDKRGYLKKLLEQEWIRNFKIVYSIRNPFDRFFSEVTARLGSSSNFPDGKKWLRNWVDEDMKIKDEVLDIISSKFLDSSQLDRAKEFTSHVLVVNLNSIDMSSILNFLGVQDDEIEFGYLNKTVYLKDEFYRNIKEFIESNKKYLTRVFTSDLMKVQNLFEVDLSNIIKEIQ